MRVGKKIVQSLHWNEKKITNDRIQLKSESETRAFKIVYKIETS